MSRIVVHTLAFNRPEMVERAARLLRETQPDGYEYVIVDVGYPLPNKAENAIELARIARDYGATLLRPYRNRSVAKNWTWIANEMELQPGDYVIGMDPDSGPSTKGWVQACVDVMRADQRIGYACVNRDFFAELDKNLHVTYMGMGGHRIKVYGNLQAWSLGGFSVDFIQKCGGLGENNEVYGYIEHWCEARMRALGYYWVMLRDHFDDHHDSPDPVYTEWKHESAARTTTQQFEAWLASRGRC